jgi:glycosyltransferase involved in cell wall biosynthesis/GT2 family glycosyltransferase
MNENDAYLFDVELPTSWTFPAGKTWIAGWFISKTGAQFRDLRLRIDDRIFAGIFGQPRPDIELRHRGYAGLPHAGFCFQVEPHRGAKLLRLEILDHGNNWSELWRQPIKVPRGIRRRQPVLDPLQIADVIGTLLKARRADPAADLMPLACRLAIEAATEPLNVHPSPPFWGALEEPSHLGHSQFGKLPTTGWLLHEKQTITRLIGSMDQLIENDLVQGQPREDAIRLFPQHPQAVRSQFFGLVELNEALPNPAALKLYAELEDGTRHLVFHRRFRQLSCNHKEQSYPEFHWRAFWEALRLLRHACGATRVSTGQLEEFWAAVREAYLDFKKKAPRKLPHLAAEKSDPYQRWLRHNRLAPALLAAMQRSAASLENTGPKIAIVADLRGITEDQLHELSAALSAQIYSRWELYLVAPLKEGTALDGIARRLASKDPRIVRIRVKSGVPYVSGLNAAVHQSAANHFALVPGNARFSPDALLHVAEVLHADTGLKLIYTDEDRMEDDGRRQTPWMKGEWNPELALSGLFPGQLTFFAKDAFVPLGSFREQADRIPTYDLLLRMGDTLQPSQVRHVPFVCYHARAAVPLEIDLADPSIEQARKALDETFLRRKWAAAAFFPPAAHHRRRRFLQPRWSKELLAENPVTVVIPTRDRLHLLEECVELLGETVDWRYVKLIIVDDHSRDTDARRYLDTIQQRTDMNCRVIRPADAAAPFNYSHLMNLALPLIDTPLILHLNNDVNAYESGWLEDMVGWLLQPGVGAVGAKLLYPDKTLNHCGVIIGPHGGLADTPFVRKAEENVPEIDWHSTARDVSAVIGGCLLTRTALYQQLDGFDEKDFGVAYNDVDYCLRLLKAGYRIVQTPQAKLMHWGSATRGVTYDESEHIAFVRKYHDFHDPQVSAALTLVEGSLQPSPAHYAHSSRAGQLRLLLITHNLNLEGAPLFLLEYASWLVKSAGFSVEVLTAADGPLRQNYEALGAHIILMDRNLIFDVQNRNEFYTRVGEVRAKIDWSKIDLVVCNTLMSFWGVHLARLANKPSLFYIHESTSIQRFFGKALREPLLPVVEDAFHDATRSLFLCRATENYYKDYDLNERFRIVPSWIQLSEIRQFKEANSRAALRRKHGYGEDEVIIANIGTVCERKGQHTFIRAVKHLQSLLNDGRKYRFVLVGGRAGIYLDLLEADIRALKLPNLEIIHETRDVYDFFGLADLFVCSSFEESFPRVVLEAMAFETPIVSTDVHGIPDMVKNRAEAWLVKPGDHLALAHTIKTCLDKERSGKSFTPTAYSKVLRYYDSERVLPHHVELAREAVLDFAPRT